MALKQKEATTDATAVEETTTTEATTEVAVKQPTAAPAVISKESSVFITNPMFLEAVVDADYGTFPSVVASNGNHQISGTDTVLGDEVQFQGILVKDSWKVVPGSNDEEAKDYFAVSTDGECVADGRSLDEALQDAKDAGYEKASIKKYIDIICLVVDCKNKDYVGETVVLQLAPSSQYTWKPIQGKCKMKAAMGKLEAVPVLNDPSLGSAVVFTSKATPTTWKGNSFTKFVFTV